MAETKDTMPSSKPLERGIETGLEGASANSVTHDGFLRRGVFRPASRKWQGFRAWLT